MAAGLAVGVAAQDAPPDPLGEPPTFLRGIYDAWAASPHADSEAEAFNHWNEDGFVEADCATCHSTPGYMDFLGADGSEAGVINAEKTPIGTVINCDACHNQAAANLSAVTFPSGVELTDVGSSARCMVCHQGRNSGLDVDAALASAGLTDDLNTVSADLRFVNIHYYPAAASLYGGEVKGGYEFAGKAYQLRNEHVEGYQTCADCHSPHTLEVRVAACADCHEDVETVEDLRDIRMQGSLVDYDGDGDIDEGIAGELETLQEMLYEAMQMYAADVAGTPIIYNGGRYPYLFADANGNGTIDEGEGGYNAFTGRLLQAAYNLQMSHKDPGSYAHNPKYYIELLYDSIEALNAELGGGVDLSLAQRDDPGHFNATADAFRHWDADGEVPGTCAKCHTAGGLPVFLRNNTNIAAPPSNSLTCSTCHSDVRGEFVVYEVDEVAMPSGARVSFGEADPNNMCLNCHQGRESTVSVNRAIARAGVGDDEVSEALNFSSPHYFAAGATLFGAEAQGAYQFEGQDYNGRNYHARNMETCTDCHNTHMLIVEYDLCTDCHENVESREDIFLIRLEEDEDIEPVDYDGDGDALEPIRDEIMTLHTALYAEIQTYAADVLGAPVIYAEAYPYWFNDLNGDGAADPDEVNYGNRFASWSPNMLRSAYNYQFVAKDPGAFAHNPDYILQVLYDSVAALGGDDATAAFTRAPVRDED